MLFLRPLVPWVVRSLSRYWGNILVDWLPFPALRELRDIAELMHQSAKDIFLAKKAEVKEMGVGANSSGDLMSILRTSIQQCLGVVALSASLVRANSSTQDKSRLTEDELIGQIKCIFTSFWITDPYPHLTYNVHSTFMLGGQETTTSALARLLHILAQEQEAQARLRSEIRKAKLAQATAQGESELSNWQHISLPYDVLMGLPYLDAVVRETIRLFPPTSMMNRMYVHACFRSFGTLAHSLSVPLHASERRETQYSTSNTQYGQRRPAKRRQRSMSRKARTSLSPSLAQTVASASGAPTQTYGAPSDGSLMRRVPSASAWTRLVRLEEGLIQSPARNPQWRPRGQR